MPQSRITNEWVLDRLDDIYPVYRVALARLLVTLRNEFDGDLDAMLVLLTVSLGTQRENWVEGLLGQHEQAGAMRVTNTLSIAQATGIPRETVRRKLDTMEAKGWITRDGAGNWVPTRRAAEDLRKGSQETIGFIRTVLAAALTARPREAEDAPPAVGLSRSARQDP
jgi:hypothetical protein